MQYEVMAPVGSRESLAAALKAGADSIYFGIESLNMRAHSASRFTIKDLHEIAQRCDELGVKSYLTVNTIIYGEDLASCAKSATRPRKPTFRRSSRPTWRCSAIAAPSDRKCTFRPNSTFRTRRRFVSTRPLPMWWCWRAN